MKSIQSALVWVTVALIVLVALPVMLVVRAFDWTPQHVRTGRTFRWLGTWTSRINPVWKVRLEVPPRAEMDHPYVVVCNHQSLADIPVVARLPWEMKWVGKKSLFQLPVMGWLMRLADDVAVDRKDPQSRAAVILRTRQVIADGVSVMFFAEGTRSKDGRLKRFFDGAFRLAVETGTPVLPLALDGTMGALPKHGWHFGEADVRLKVLDAIPTLGLTLDDVPELRERTRRAIAEQIAAWRGTTPEAVTAPAPTGADHDPDAPTAGASGDGAVGSGAVEDEAKSIA